MATGHTCNVKSTRRGSPGEHKIPLINDAGRRQGRGQRSRLPALAGMERENSQQLHGVIPVIAWMPQQYLKLIYMY